MPVREFVINTAEKYYGKSHLEVNNKAEDAISDFIHNSQVLLLQGFLENDNLILYTKIQDDKRKSIVFYKTSAQELNYQDGMRNVNIITLSNSAAESLYQILRQIYSPLLANGDDLYSNKLQKNLTELESNLRILTHGRGDGNINVILSIDDELDYWKTIGQKKDASKKEREAASNFCELFEDLCEEIRVLQSSGVAEMREAAENMGGILDDVWRSAAPLPYLQARMAHTFDVCGHIICSTIQKALSTLHLWKVEGNAREAEVVSLLWEALRAVRTWTGACRALTETYWPNYALHAWTGAPYVPAFCLNLQHRLQQIYDIRSTYNQLTKLLSNNERAELMTNQLFEPFENINVWACNGPNQAWESAVSRFSANLRPAEVKVAEKLKPRLHNTSTKQMLYEFMRYKTLIERPLVKHALSGELELFVSSILAMLQGVRGELRAGGAEGGGGHRPVETSRRVHHIQWAKQLEAKVKDIQTCAEKYLKEFEGSAEVARLAAEVLRELKEVYTQLHEEWCRDVQAAAKSGELEIAGDQPVVEFSAETRMMVVRYSARAGVLAGEARVLAALGLPPPPAARLHNAADTRARALALNQVASFHNTLGERMIASTRAMMLPAALELSALVQGPQQVCWGDVHQLDEYTRRLQHAVRTLDRQNSYLTSQHLAIRSIVEKLMDTELLAKQSEWKKRIKDIRDIIEKVEAEGYKNTEGWRVHWEWQVYKALECQYARTLLAPHQHFPAVRVDLVLRGHLVRVSPPLEELRVQHYQQLRRLVALPAHVPPLRTAPAPTAHASAPAAPAATDATIFADIVHKHGWLGNKAVSHLERALCAVERVCAEWSARAALGCVPELGALCRQQLHARAPDHWEHNFRACKAYGQAVAKMTFEDEKIEWIIVCTATLRRELEAQARNLWGCLLASLQASCGEDGARLDAFVAQALLTLQDAAPPQSARELAELSARYHALHAALPEMEKLVGDLKRKCDLLRTWGGDAGAGGGAGAGGVAEWRKVTELLAARQQMFEHQAEIVKSSLSGEWENLHTGLESWLARARRAEAEGAGEGTLEELVQRARAVGELRAGWGALAADRDRLLKECEKFDMKLDVPNTWTEAETLINNLTNMWSVIEEYYEEYSALCAMEWAVCGRRLHLVDELVGRWRRRLEPYTPVTLRLQRELDRITELTPMLKYVRGTDFTERHWREVFTLLGVQCARPDTLTAAHWLGGALAPADTRTQLAQLQKICAAASSEACVRAALTELELWWAGARLELTRAHTAPGAPTPPPALVRDLNETLAKVEEQQWVVSSVGGGAGAGAGVGGAGGDACAGWERRLRAARTLLRSLHHAQRRWVYLEPILSTDTGELGGKFAKVDQGFRQVARLVEADPRLSALVQSPRLQPMLDGISDQLLACQAALSQYMDEKRSIFPRLYFLSDDDLLELLGQARAGAGGGGGAEGRGAVLQTQLKKLFPGAAGVRLGPAGLALTALVSRHGDALQLDRPVDIDCPVETWLKNLETEMRSSLRNLVLKCAVTSSLPEQDPFSLPTQILCLAQNIRFTEQAERAITSKELHKLKENVEKENLYYAAAEVENEGEGLKKQALILQCASYMSIIRALIDNNVASTNDWLWQKQLRFYVTRDKEVVARMGLAEVPYSYEYLGVDTGQLVRTELTDECFLILTQALHLGLVGNPFGPAGTGKTESVKALGALVGRLVLIFNCDEAMDAECMGRLLTGLAASGAWGCFDELNRLGAHTLGALAHQLDALLAATAAARAPRPPSPAPQATLNGKQVVVSPWCGVAATMNPAGRGYGGRRTLPAALQRVLRPVAMTHPRPDQLATHLLHAKCMENPEKLALDLHTVFQMASTLLSNQRHYDWGLRALKAAVGGCGGGCGDGGERGGGALRRALALNSVSKLTRQDAARFENILTAVFGEAPEDPAADTMGPALEAAVASLGLVHNKSQIEKCKELNEQMQQRMGVALVGPPGAGKTTIRRLLTAALSQQGKTITEYVIGPKAMSRAALLGSVDRDTRHWTDGVISTVAARVASTPPTAPDGTEVCVWIVLDGDVDPAWVEALNSVLDDNRLLTLPSGGRVQLPAHVHVLLETHALQHASPATVSRLGIILLSEEDSCAGEVVSRWVSAAEGADVERARLLQQTAATTLRWLADHPAVVAYPVHPVALVKQMITQLEYLVAQSGGATPAEELIHAALARSVLPALREPAAHQYYQQISELLGPPPLPPVGAGVGAGGGGGEWVEALYLSERVRACEAALRAVLHAPHAHALLLAPTASAADLLAEYVLKETNSTYIAIDCSPIMEPEDIIAVLKKHNVIRSGVGGAGGGVGGEGAGAGAARVTLLVRGLHRARTDEWGSRPVHDLLLQLIQQGAVWVCSGEGAGGAEGVEGAARCGARVRVVGTAAHAHALAPRLLANVHALPLREPGEKELLELARHHLRASADRALSDAQVGELAAAALALYNEVCATFTSHAHYQWSAAHLRRWCTHVRWYLPAPAPDAITHLHTLEQSLNLISPIQALASEANLIFRDRLVSEEEKATFSAILRRHLRGAGGVAEAGAGAAGGEGEEACFVPRVRGDGVYLQPAGWGEWSQETERLINQCLSEQEHAFGWGGAEVCPELARLCVAVARASQGGIAVLVGSAGVGRGAAARVVGAALSATVHSVEHAQHFHTHYKNAVSAAGEGSRALLVVGPLAADRHTLAAIESHTHAAVPPVPAPAPDHHAIHNIQQNLGIVICLDKDQQDLWELLEQFPLLHASCQLTWLDAWGERTLRDMPARVIQRLMKEEVSDPPSEEQEPIPVDAFVSIHSSVEESLRAPSRYVALVTTYHRVHRRQRARLHRRRHMLASGVEALQRARSSVSALESEARAQQAALEEAQGAATRALQQIGATVRATTDRKDEMHHLKKSIEEENEKLQIRKKEIEAELASVEPVIAAARAAVGDIKTEALSEVRSLRAPPDVVRDVLEGVLRLMGVADTSWHSMKTFLAKRGVKEDIRCLDASQISPEAAASVQRLLERRGASFEASAARRASAACAPLAAWVRANLAYAAALQRVQPLQEQQKQLTRNLAEAESQLSALSSGLATVDERVAALQEQLGRHTRDAASTELRLRTATHTLAAARTLLAKLATEYTAWEADLETISVEMSELTLRSVLSAAYLVYLSEATEGEARAAGARWAAAAGRGGDAFEPQGLLASTDQQVRWDADGLPKDNTAVKNAIVIDQMLSGALCGVTPLVVDPDGDAWRWLQLSLADTPHDVVSQRSDRLHTAVQHALRLGRVLVVTDVSGVHAAWWGVARGVGGAGGAAGGARLLLYARAAPAPASMPPALAARLALVHFTPRLHGLTDQLVHYALQQQHPDVNEKAKEMKLKKAALQKQQHELQENLLRDLSSHGGDILHDAALLESLNSTRATGDVIADALRAAEEVQATVRARCEAYSASAGVAAGLALAVRALGERRPLVTLPPDALRAVYVEAIQREPGENIDSESVVRHVAARVVGRVVLALPRRHKYTAALQLLRHVYPQHMPETLWQIFTGSHEVPEDKDVVRVIRDQYSWVPDHLVPKLAQLKAASGDLFARLSLDNAELWSVFLRGGELGSLSPLRLAPFELAAAVAALRPDSLYRAVVQLVDHMLGADVVIAGDALGRAARWAGAGAGAGAGGGGRPVLLLGAHAADQLAAHAPHKLQQVSVEAGPDAWWGAVRGAAGAGGAGWAVLHVGAAPFSQELLAFIEEFRHEANDLHEDFRLWIVSEDRDIPPLVANACVNVILEAPEGVKHNVVGSLCAWGEAGAGGAGGAGERASPRGVRTLACLALLHALVQERRAYIPQGWSKWYSWEWGELRACRRVVADARVGGVEAARALCLALYSARVDAPADRRTLAALVHACLGEHALAHAWRPNGTDVQLPFGTQLQAYTAALSSLPAQDSAALLGLPDNCRAGWERAQGAALQAGLRELSSAVVARGVEGESAGGGGGGGGGGLRALWKKLMAGSPFLKAEREQQQMPPGWWGCVCAGEELDAARGAPLLHRALARHARIHTVPEAWQLVWEGPDAPPAYLREFCHRAHAAAARPHRPPRPPIDHYMPTELDLRSLFRPERALCALRATCAARARTPPARLAPALRWGAEATEAVAGESMVLVGLVLCGCEWDGASGGLAPSPAHAPPHAPAPNILLTYTAQDSDPADRSVVVPLYSSPARESLIVECRAPLAPHYPPALAAAHAPALAVRPVH